MRERLERQGRQRGKEGDEVPNGIRCNCVSEVAAAAAAGAMDSLGRSDCSCDSGFDQFGGSSSGRRGRESMAGAETLLFIEQNSLSKLAPLLLEMNGECESAKRTEGVVSERLGRNEASEGTRARERKSADQKFAFAVCDSREWRESSRIHGCLACRCSLCAGS